MENVFSSLTPLDFELFQGKLQSPPQLEDYDNLKEDTTMFNGGMGDHLFGSEDQLGDVNNSLFSHDLYQDLVFQLSNDPNTHHDLQQQQQSKAPDLLISENVNFAIEIARSQHDSVHAGKAGKDHQQQQQQSKCSSSLGIFSNFEYFSFPSRQFTQLDEEGVFFPQRQIGGSDFSQTNKQMPPPQSGLATMEFLYSFGSAFKKLNDERSQSSSRAAKGNEVYQCRSYVANGKRKLSTEEVMRVAGARYLRFANQGYRDFYMPRHPFGNELSGLSEEDFKDVELAYLLLGVAEKVGYQQFESASRLLMQCEWNASIKVTPVQRVVFCFAEALRERIQKETGVHARKGNEEWSQCLLGLGTNLSYIACYQQVPFHPVLQFTAIQAIVENVAGKSRIHLIDLEIRCGVQWTGLMEALVARQGRPVELLTITAVGVRGKQNIKESGERLEVVAKSLNLPFQFKQVIVSDMEDIKDHLFDEIEADEAVVVYAALVLRTMIRRPSCLENLMRVMRNINPSLMVVIEVEANHNSPSFVNRFIDALFYYSAFFDCLETCMKQDKYRAKMEDFLCDGIRNIVAAEGSERVSRSVKLDVWRAFFARCGMQEMSLSNSSLDQARLVAKKVRCTTLGRNGECLTVGWKGTPIHSLSAWKFH